MTSASHSLSRHPSLPDPASPLTPSGNLRRRLIASRVVRFVATTAAAFAVLMLVDMVYTVVSHGASALSLDFFTTNPSGLAGGGILNYLLGSAVVVGVGAVMALPIGILTGIYLTEFARPDSRPARALKLVLDLLQGLPTVIVAVFVVGLMVIPAQKETGFAAAVALGIVMLPLIARSCQEVLLLVPGAFRDAADALGVHRWRTVVSVILPAAMGGIATGAILSIARAAGETAPVLLCDSIFNPNQTQLELFGQGVPTIPMYIFTNYDLPNPDALTRAWGAAFALLAFILLANIGARLLLARSRRKLHA